VAETIKDGKWHWYSVMHDLAEQGGLVGVVVDPLTVSPYGCSGVTKAGTKFYITWITNTFLLISLSQEEPALIEAFARVVEYRPFCRYVSENNLITFEWDKEDPEGRFMQLSNEDITILQRVT